MRVLALFAGIFALLAFAGKPASAPVFGPEQLHYNINWPSGLSLGEVTLRASQSQPDGKAARYSIDLNIYAGIPGFAIQDAYRASASPEWCSLQFDKDAQHGRKKIEEKTTFDPRKGSGVRETAHGGRTELHTPACPRDALTYLYFLRRELAQGRLPAPQPVYFGSEYQVRVEYAGTETIRLGSETPEADRLKGTVRGPSSSFNFEAYFLKDSSRTLALARVPLSVGALSMELVR